MAGYTLFLGIMWNRLGTPTPRAASGTVEEFERAVEARKQKGQPEIWFYFRESPSKLDTEEQLEQRKRVLEFKKHVEANGMPWPYKNPTDFRNKFNRQMVLWLNARARMMAALPTDLQQNLKHDVPPDTVRLKGKQTFRAYGFFTPRGYVITDRIPFERERQLVAESSSEEGPFKVQLTRFAGYIPFALAHPIDVPLAEHPMNVRPAGSLAIGEAVELYRSPKYTTHGRVLRKFVKVDLSGAHGIETQERLLETTNISASGDSGAPVVDGQKQVVGMLYGGSDEASLTVPI